MSLKIDDPFFELCCRRSGNGTKITIEDLKKLPQNKQIPFFKLLSRPDIDVEMLKWIYERDEFIFSNYPSDDALIDGKEILLNNRNISLDIVKFMSTVVNNIELLENVIE